MTLSDLQGHSPIPISKPFKMGFSVQLYNSQLAWRVARFLFDSWASAPIYRVQRNDALFISIIWRRQLRVRSATIEFARGWAATPDDRLSL